MVAGNRKKKDPPPLFLNEILSFLNQEKKDLDSIFDATLGDGGHSAELKKAFPNVKIVALDQDLEAIQKAKKKFSDSIEKGEIKLIQSNFLSFSQRIKTQWIKKNKNLQIQKKLNSAKNLKKGPPLNQKGDLEDPIHFEFLNKNEKLKCDDNLNFLEAFDALLFDLGPSLSQLTQSDRGFSFYTDGPLDMRMNQGEKIPTASDILNTSSQEDLMRLFINYGEIKRPLRVVHAILKERKKKPFSRTLELSKLIEKTLGWKKRSHHPATQFFQSLRIQVNDELSQVQKSLPHFLHLLKPGGLFFIISFHSLEDRLIKLFFKDLKKQKKGRLLTSKVIQASYKEKKSQPRLRSAKLRIFQKFSTISIAKEKDTLRELAKGKKSIENEK